jgi:hypothetical protein
MIPKNFVLMNEKWKAEEKDGKVVFTSIDGKKFELTEDEIIWISAIINEIVRTIRGVY